MFFDKLQMFYLTLTGAVGRKERTRNVTFNGFLHRSHEITLLHFTSQHWTLEH